MDSHPEFPERTVMQNLRLALVLLFVAPALLHAQPKDTIANRFTRTDAMITMRDGVKLFTITYAPKDIKGNLPFILLRTPYGIDTRGPGALQAYLKDLADEGYIFVFQDIRGRFKSEGRFVMSRAPRDPKDAKAIDEGTDTFDTIDWLLKNVPNNNGKVGMLGISYPGWLTVMGALDPHPALKAISPQASPADQFIGDDFHHNGAFRLSYGFEYVAMMETSNVNTYFKFDRFDTYEWYLKLGALSNVNEKIFKGKMPTWNDFVKHPNYDEHWQKQAFDPYLTKVTVPTLNVGGWFDQEDYRGPMQIYKRLEVHDKKNQNFLVIGPWNHGGWANGPGDKLGRLDFDSATGQHFRAKVQAPWFNWHLKGKGDHKPPEALLFQTGSNQWVAHDTWPPKNAESKKLYFWANGKLAFTPEEPREKRGAFDRYVSDPAKPVPYRPRPVTPTYPGKEWQTWMAEDQRFTHERPDVLTYETDPLDADVTLAGQVTARLFASTSGTDSDFIVRLIDAHPQSYPKDPTMGGFQMLIIGEPVRARFRKSFEKPEAVEPGEVNEYSIDLHWSHHCFRKGHKIMVQVSSTWFPLIDRNPQKYVPNIFEAKDSDFQSAEQRVYRSAKHPSHLSMEILNSPTKDTKQHEGKAARKVKHIIAHRGSSADRPENTLASYHRAIEAGATIMEMDVRSTKDGALISLHDADLKRTTNGTGLAINMTLADIRKLDAGSWFDPKYKDERVPTMQEILELGKGKIDILLDLQEKGEDYANRVVAEVRKFGEPKRTWIGVRTLDHARQFRKLLPEAKQIGLIPTADSIDAFAEAKVDMIRLWPKWLNDKTLIPRVRKHGLPLHLNGTLGMEDETRALLAHEPDSLASDDPARLVATLKSIAAPR